jgi:hypothetical protein
MNRYFARGQTTAILNKIIRRNKTPYFHSKERYMRLNVKDDPWGGDPTWERWHFGDFQESPRFLYLGFLEA